MVEKQKGDFFDVWVCLIIGILSVSSVNGKTRWSSLSIVPDADMFYSGEFSLGFNGYLTKNFDDKLGLKSTVPIEYGLTEWVNFEFGYSEGITFGIKCRLVGEHGTIIPSIVLGVHNLFHHKEVNYFSVDSTNNMGGEVYIAFSKSIEMIKTRIHFGMQSIPKSENDKFTVFSAIEKYFGHGLYTSLELFQRDKLFHFSLFANWRIFKNHLAISVGAVELQSMFFDKNNKFAFSLAPSDSQVFVKPGIWVGIHYHGRMKFGKNKGFISIEDRFSRQNETVKTLVKEVDSLTKQLGVTEKTLNTIQRKVSAILDSSEGDPSSWKNIFYNKLNTLKTLYHAEPFVAEKVKLLIDEIVSFREKAVPPLLDFLMDKKVDREIRMYSATLLGEIKYTSSTDVLLDVLVQTNDPDIKIEILISLGKMKETRAMYLMEQLANSPNDAIAITAQEVLRRLSAETGALLSPGINLRKISVNTTQPLEKKSTTPSTHTNPIDSGKTNIDSSNRVHQVPTQSINEETVVKNAPFVEEDIKPKDLNANPDIAVADTAINSKKEENNPKPLQSKDTTDSSAIKLSKTKKSEIQKEAENKILENPKKKSKKDKKKDKKKSNRKKKKDDSSEKEADESDDKEW